MAQLLNLETGKVEIVDDAAVTKAVASGAYSLPKGRIEVTDANGQRGTIDAAEATHAFGQLGYRFTTPAELEEERLQEKYEGRPLAAGALAAADAAALGLGKTAAVKAGILDKETAENLPRFNKGATTVGEVLGTVGPALIPGGQYTLAGATARAGVTAERVAARALGESLVAKAAAGAAGGLVTEGLAGLGTLVGEEALGEDKELTAQKLVGTVGLRTLLGAGAGALGGVAGYGLTKGIQRLREAGVDLVDDAEKTAFARASEAHQKQLQSAQGEFRAEVQKGSRMGEVLSADRGGGDTSRTVSQVLQEKQAELDALKQLHGELKDVAEARGVEAEDIHRAGEFNTSGSKLDVAQKAATKAQGYEEAMGKVQAELDALKKRNPADIVEDVRGEEFLKLREAARKDPRLQELERGVVESYADALPEQLAKIQAKREVVSTLKENADASIREAAQKQLSGEAAFARAKELALRYGPPAIGSVAGSTFGGPVGAMVGAGAGALAGRAVDAMGALAGAGMRPALQSLYRTVTQYPAVKNALGKFILGLTEKTPGVLGPYAALLANAAADGEDTLLATHLAMSDSDEGYRNTMAKAGLHYGGSGVDALRKAASLEKVQAAAAHGDERQDAAVAGFLAGKARPTATKRQRLADFKGVSNTLAQYAANPEAFIDSVAKRTASLSQEAPETAGALMATTQRALAYLQAEVPKAPAEALNIPALRRPWAPTDADLSRFEKKLVAVQDPYSVLEDMAAGQVTREAVEALQAVYPQLLDDTRQRLMQRLATHGTALDYRQRLSLSHVLGMPVDASMKPETVAALQQLHAVPAPKQPGTHGPPLNLASGSMTETERLLARRNT
jgi:hypothetical protein